jgi:hypothetical protein
LLHTTIICLPDSCRRRPSCFHFFPSALLVAAIGLGRKQQVCIVCVCEPSGRTTATTMTIRDLAEELSRLIPFVDRAVRHFRRRWTSRRPGRA